MNFLTVKNVTQHDLDNVINSLLLAFSADPVVRWMYPSPKEYLENFPHFVRTFGYKALELKTVYTIDNYSGAAFWFPPHTEPEKEAVVEMLQRTIPQQQQEEVFTMLETMSHEHPQEPHWYLGIIGVEPTQRRKGYGSALIQHILDICDQAGPGSEADRQKQVVYLESSNQDNIPFYEHHGFEIINQIKVGNSPTIFPMLRYPQKN